MADETPRFIRRLVTDVPPVRPLAPPWIRTAAWCGISLPVVGLIVVLMSRAGGSWAGSDRLTFEQIAALATGIAAAAAAFASTVPGYDRRIALLPLAPLAIWLGNLAQRCVRDGVASESHSWSLLAHWGCLPETLIVGAVPAVTVVAMLRRGAPLTPRLTTMLGALAAGGLANFGIRCVHALDSSLVVLTWHFSGVFALSLASTLVGRYLFNWRRLSDRLDTVS